MLLISAGYRETLKKRREALGLSQGDLGKLIGVGRQSICNMENSDSNPTLRTLTKWADALGYRLELVDKHSGGRK